MKPILLAALCVSALFAQETKPNTATIPGVTTLVGVRRIYVGQLTGGIPADALRDLIIASLNSTKLFVLTDNEARADAVLKGAADDKTFTDSFDSYEGMSGRDALGKSGSALTTKVGSVTGGSALSENTKPTPRCGFVTRTATFSGLPRKKVWAQNFAAPVRMWRQRLHIR